MGDKELAQERLLAVAQEVDFARRYYAICVPTFSGRPRDDLPATEVAAALEATGRAFRFNRRESFYATRERGAPGIGEALLDQRALAGLGNVFKSEVCFEERVHPFMPVSALDDAALLRLVRTARRLLAMNVRESSGWDRATRPGMRTTGRLDSSAGLWVYGRAGKPCRVCGEPVVRQHRGPEARSTFFCPRCQSLPAVLGSAFGERLQTKVISPRV